MPSPIVFFVGAAIALVIAARHYLPRRAFAGRARRVEGTVVSHTVKTARRRKSGAPDRREYAVVEYDLDGRSARVTSTIGSLRPDPVGTRLPVLYDPGAPDDASIDSPRELYGQAGVYAVIAGVAAAAGLVSLAIHGF